jgi:hypothetical protein
LAGPASRANRRSYFLKRRPEALAFCPPKNNYRAVTVETFKPEIAEALKAFEKYIVCLDKTPEDCEASLVSLMEKAIKAYQNRGPNLRHGIALDKQVTIILSQTETDRPLCGIYFNLSSPYHKKNGKTVGKLD